MMMWMMTDVACRFGIQGVLGAMDGTHVRIRTPSSLVSRAYYDKDGNHSIILHIVCDYEFVHATGLCPSSFIAFLSCRGLIYEASVGMCGSSGDSTVWRNQPLYQALSTTYDDRLLNRYCCNEHVILHDETFRSAFEPEPLYSSQVVHRMRSSVCLENVSNFRVQHS